MNDSGLTTQEAATLLEKYGRNEITSSHKIRPLEIFLAQFKSFLILILFLAAGLAALAGERIDTIFILIIIILNAIFGFFQEYKAEKAIAALKNMVVTRVRVIRDGREVEIDTTNLVPGDIFLIEEGQKIPADAKLLEAINLEVNEAPLTGESVPVAKEATDSDEDKYFVFMGTVAERGKGRAIVTSTGMSTKFGKIASLLKEIKDEQTPLQNHLNVLGKQLGIIAIFGAGLVFVLGIYHDGEIIETLLTGASLAVAIVPEGLPAIVTITLALGVQRMARRQSLIRKLSSIEAIGSVGVICSDKTGTMTKNEMTVRKVWFDGETFEVGDPKLNTKQKTFSRLLRIGILCNDATVTEDDGKQEILGDRTEGSLLVLAKNKAIDLEKYKQTGKLLNQFPFDSNLKRMSVMWGENDINEILSKGAPETILERSTKIQSKGTIRDLSNADKKEIRSTIEELAGQGFRLLGLGFSEFSGDLNKVSRENVEKNLTFVGIVAIADPPRNEVKEAINLARNAGIRVVMITGDNPLTAAAIGQEIGLISAGEEVISGSQIEKMETKDLEQAVEKVMIFARVTPEQKLKIVKAFQSKDIIVAVTGDGVNDSPALKQADVGLAMGIIGTDVAKEASDMVITDDNFSSIVSAVEEGRVIYENILKSIRYLLACNAGELLTILGAVAVGFPSPLTPVQILWMNLVTDGMPALALSKDPKTFDIMSKPPRSKSIPILTILGKRYILITGSILAFITLSVYLIILRDGDVEKARTFAFTILVLGQMVVAFTVRRGAKWNSNKLLIASVIATVLLQFLILTVPAFRNIFDVVSIL